MKNIYRFNRTRGFYSASISVSDTSFTANFTKSINDESRTGDSDAPLIEGPEISISMTVDQLKQVAEFDDGAALSFNIEQLEIGSEPDWKNLYLGTYVGRRKMIDSLVERNFNSPFRILVPASGITSMRQCKFILQMHSPSSELTSSDQIVLFDTPAGFTANQFVPEISGPTSAAAGEQGFQQFGITLKDSEGGQVSASGTVYVEATAGQLSHQRVTLDQNGCGSFGLSFAGLQPGETVKIKSGFRYFPGVDDHFVVLE